MKTFSPAFLTIGAVMTLGGAISYITHWAYAPYILLIGSVLFTAGQIASPVHAKTSVLRRLRMQQILGSVLLIATGILMLTTHGNEWIACLTIAALFELYTAFRIPQEIEKEKQ